MANAFIGEIRLFAGNFAPAGWAFCNGQLMPITENEALFALIGTTYGGDGQSSFALPDLRGRVPLHQGPGYAMGQTAGAETVTLTLNQIPAHGHAPRGSTAAASVSSPGGAVLAATSVNSYGPGPAGVDMAPQAIAAAGGSQAHDNMAPTLALSYIVSLFGIFPSQN